VSRIIDRPSAECVQRDEHSCIVDGLLYWQSAANEERKGVRVIRGDCESDRALSRDDSSPRTFGVNLQRVLIRVRFLLSVPNPFDHSDDSDEPKEGSYNSKQPRDKLTDGAITVFCTGVCYESDE